MTISIPAGNPCRHGLVQSATPNDEKGLCVACGQPMRRAAYRGSLDHMWNQTAASMWVVESATSAKETE